MGTIVFRRSVISREIRIGKAVIGENAAPFVIAEISGNHNGSLERALRIVDAAADAGVHAVKIQTYTADTMTLDLSEGEFLINDPGSLWNGYSLYRLYDAAHTPWEWHEEIFERCRRRGVIGFSTPFDASAVELLETLNPPLYKIASFEIVDIPLIKKVAEIGKPIVISTGLATEDEIGDAVAAARSAGCRDLILLKCTSAYPAKPESANLLTIPTLRKRFGCEVGLSDHTLGVGVAVAAVCYGATVIEKHLTLSRAEGGVDAAFSMEPGELAAIVRESDSARRAKGSSRFGPTPAEEASLRFRRSLYVIHDLDKGDVIAADDIGSIRPGFGLKPKHLDSVLGRRAKRFLKRGTPLSFDDVT